MAKKITVWTIYNDKPYTLDVGESDHQADYMFHHGGWIEIYLRLPDSRNPFPPKDRQSKFLFPKEVVKVIEVED